jgi:carbon storage regulator CsrA
MLVLSRKVDDTIIIGDNIKIQVIKIKGNTIRLGIEAPSDVKILRGELAPYGVSSEKDTNSEPVNPPKTRFANSTPAIEFEVTQDELESLPNPFAQAS